MRAVGEVLVKIIDKVEGTAWTDAQDALVPPGGVYHQGGVQDVSGNTSAWYQIGPSLSKLVEEQGWDR